MSGEGAERDGEVESLANIAERRGLDGEQDGERTTMARLLEGGFLQFLLFLPNRAQIQSLSQNVCKQWFISRYCLLGLVFV